MIAIQIYGYVLLTTAKIGFHIDLHGSGWADAVRFNIPLGKRILRRSPVGLYRPGKLLFGKNDLANLAWHFGSLVARRAITRGSP